jgi:hypothetical protein
MCKVSHDNQRLMQECQPRAGRESRLLDAADADSKAVEARSVGNNLRLQIVRCMNEVGAENDDAAMSAPEEPEAIASHKSGLAAAVLDRLQGGLFPPAFATNNSLTDISPRRGS